MSQLYYSPASVGDIYQNTTEYNSYNYLDLENSDPVIILNGSDEIIFRENVCNKIIDLKTDLINELYNFDTKNIQIDTKIKDFVNNASELINDYKREQINMIQLEKLYQDEVNHTNKLIKSLSSYNDIVIKLEKEYINSSDSKENVDNIINNISLIVDKISNNNKLNEAKNNYFTSRNKLLSYFELVKYLNKDNMGSTCSLCYINQVDHFMLPCGHTLCSSCKNRLNLNQNDNCIYCRKNIESFKSLYYI
tara:strand:+ start:342 stop:1091 length:750 start_codon:yes stop_codon:yes gene_type:complete